MTATIAPPSATPPLMDPPSIDVGVGSDRVHAPTRKSLPYAALRRAGAVLSAAGSRVWRLLRPVLVAVRPLGWVAVVGAVGAWAISRTLGWQEFTVVAAACAAAVVVAAAQAVGRARFHVGLDLRSRRVTVGERASGRMTVTNTSHRRSLPARIELPVGIATASFPLPSLRGAETHEETFLVPTQRRAVIPVGPVRSVRGDALGLVRRVVHWTKPDVLYVHPRTIGLDGAAPGFLKDLEGQASRELSNDDVSFHALRTYVPGDDRRYIHWKTSARSLATPAHTLMVRQFEETRRSHLTVSLSTRRSDYAEDDEFELAVEIAASLGVQAFRDSRQLSVVTSGAPIPSATVHRMLDGFSGIAMGESTGGIVAVARSTALFAPDVSVAFLVCGASPTPAQIRSAAMAFPVGVRVLAIRAVVGAASVMSRIGDVAVLTVGALDRLPRVLRQAVRTV